MTRRGARYALVIAALFCLAASGTVHPYIAPLCLGWLILQYVFLDRRGVRVPEGPLAMLHIWLGIVFLWFALVGRRGTDIDLMDLLLGFGAPFLVLKVAAPPTRFNEAITVMASVVLALGTAATAPGLIPVANLAVFLVTLCLATPALIRREATEDDGVTLRVLDGGRGWRFASVAAGIALATVGLALGAVLYLFVPRMTPTAGEEAEEPALDIQARRHARKAPVSGFARTIRLGDIGNIKRDNRVAFEAQCRRHGQPFDVPRFRSEMLLMRMRAWDTYATGTGEWTRRLGRLTPIRRNGLLAKRESSDPWPLDWTIRAMGYGGRTLAVPQRAGRVRTPGIRVLRGPADALIAEEPVSEYGIEADEPVTRRSEFEQLVAGDAGSHLLSVPSEIVTALRERMPRSQGGRVVDYLTAIERYFTQNNFRYTLQLPPTLPTDSDPVLAFLERREGHCELYAAAACLMLRLYGVPARVAGGMRMTLDTAAGGRGRYQARFSDAHAWVEFVTRDHGWVAYDFTPPDRRAVEPTPLSAAGADENAAELGIGERGGGHADAPPLIDWSDPFSFGRADQARFRQRVWRTVDGSWFTVAGGALLAWALFVVLRSAWRRRRASPLRVRAPSGTKRSTLAFYARWLKQCSAQGHRRKRSQTPREFLNTLPAALSVEGREVTARFEALRYN